MKSWELGSSLIALLLAATATPQAYGRFSAELPPAPGFIFTAQGFRVADAPSDTIRWQQEGTYTLEAANDRQAEYKVSAGKHGPERLRINLRSPGFDLKMPAGGRLDIRSFQRPLLTVSDATYDGASTPRVRWILLSFREQQPPVLFAFLDGENSARIEGSPGAWTLRFGPVYDRWMRVCLPFGQRPIPYGGPPASVLGQAARRLAGEPSLWLAPSARSVSVASSYQEGRLRVRWEFDRAGVVVPPALLLAGAGGYQARLISPHQLVEAPMSHGPTAFLTTPVLEAEFPFFPVQKGLPVVPLVAEPPKPQDAAGRWMMALLSARRRSEDVAAADQRLKEIQAGLVTGPAPLGRLAPVVMEDGGAAWAEGALLQELLQPGKGSLLPSLLWRRDALTWSTGLSPAAEAIVVLAASLSSSPTRQIDACQLMASAAAQAPLAEFRRQMGLTEGTKGGPWPDWLSSRFRGEPKPTDAPWLQSLRSSVWTEDQRGVFLRVSEGEVILSWTHAEGSAPRLVLETQARWKAAPKSNLASLAVSSLPGQLILDYKPSRSGLCEVRLTPGS